MRRWGVVVLLSGCLSQHVYLAPASVAAATGLGWAEAKRTVVAARRVEDGSAVLLKADALAAVEPASSGAVRLHTSAHRPLAIAGWVLLPIGVGLIAPGAYYLQVGVSASGSSDNVFALIPGSICTAFGASLAVLGAILLGVGYGQRPEEVSAPRAEVRYFEGR
jgi:hypothetical protein